MVETDDAAELFARLAVELHDTAGTGPEGTAETLVEFALHAVGCRHAGLALSTRGRLEIAAVSGPWVAQIMAFQLETGEGPLATAITYDTVVWVRDARSDPRWPLWSARMDGSVVRNVLQVPLRSNTRTVGVLSLYGTNVNGFSTEDEAIAQLIAQQAAAVAVSTAEHTRDLMVPTDARSRPDEGR